MFHRQYPERRIKPGTMLKVMKQAGLRLKKIEVSNIPAKKEQRVQEFEDKTVDLDKKLHDIIASGGHLVFLDECIFKSRDFKRKAWSKPYDNLFVEDRTQKQPCQAICVAICSCCGVLAQHQADYSFTHETFIEMLDCIHGAVGDERIYLFLDGASIHRNLEVK